MQTGLALAAVALAWPNAEAGLVIARDAAVEQALLARDIRVGVPSEFIDSHHQAYLFPPGEGVAGPGLERLRLAGAKPFDRIAPPVTLTPHPIAWTAVGVAPDPRDGTVTAGPAELIQYTARFAEPTRGPAIAIEYELAGPRLGIDSEASWVWPGPEGPLPRLVRKPLLPGHVTRRLWLGYGVREVTFTVRGPATLRMDKIEELR